jgi:hypothetical protein
MYVRFKHSAFSIQLVILSIPDLDAISHSYLAQSAVISVTIMPLGTTTSRLTAQGVFEV